MAMKKIKIDVFMQRDGKQFEVYACMGKYNGGAFRRDSCGRGVSTTPTMAVGKAVESLGETLLKRSDKRGVRRYPGTRRF